MRRSFQAVIRLFVGLSLVLSVTAAGSAGNVGTMKVHFLDVGYADAVLVELPGGTALLIDAAGAAQSQDVMTYLRAQGVRELEAAILTHPHENHAGGFAALMEKFPVQAFYFNGDERAPDREYLELREKWRDAGLVPGILRTGDVLTFSSGDVILRVLHPAVLAGSTNESSLVCLVVYGRTSFLLTADIGPGQQTGLLAQFPEIASADVVQVPHHGGELAGEWVSRLSTRIFVVSTGTGARGQSLEEEIAKLRGRVLRTDTSGTIIIESDGQNIAVK